MEGGTDLLVGVVTPVDVDRPNVVVELETLVPCCGATDGEHLLAGLSFVDGQDDLINDFVGGTMINGAAGGKITAWPCPRHPSLELRVYWAVGAAVSHCCLQGHRHVLVDLDLTRRPGDR